MKDIDLSPVARSYLQRQLRDPFLPTSRIEQLLRDRGIPLFEPWLSFHERYAGHRGFDDSVLGLAFASPQWLPPDTVDAERDEGTGLWLVRCADHPNPGFRLDERGVFLADLSDSYDVFVEREAHAWDFHQAALALGKTTRPLSRQEAAAFDPLSPDGLELLAHQVIAEASDTTRICVRSPEVFLILDASSKVPLVGRRVC